MCADLPDSCAFFGGVVKALIGRIQEFNVEVSFAAPSRGARPHKVVSGAYYSGFQGWQLESTENYGSLVAHSSDFN